MASYFCYISFTVFFTFECVLPMICSLNTFCAASGSWANFSNSSSSICGWATLIYRLIRDWTAFLNSVYIAWEVLRTSRNFVVNVWWTVFLTRVSGSSGHVCTLSCISRFIISRLYLILLNIFALASISLFNWSVFTSKRRVVRIIRSLLTFLVGRFVLIYLLVGLLPHFPVVLLTSFQPPLDVFSVVEELLNELPVISPIVRVVTKARIYVHNREIVIILFRHFCELRHSIEHFDLTFIISNPILSLINSLN